MDISVIVPIYNVEKYIEKCLRSLFEQTKTDGVEFILVNDCTPDGSMMIARNLIAEYSHLEIKILEHAENRGLAATRQTGFDAAIGDYIIQIDSDDWCELNMLEEMYVKAIEENVDIVACDHFDFEDNVYKSIHSEDRLENVSNLILHIGLSSCVWSKLIKSDLYIKNGVKCNNGINYGEDTFIMPILYYLADKVFYHPHAYLHYTFNPQSLTNIDNVNKSLDQIKRLYLWEEFFQNTPVCNLNFTLSINDRKCLYKHLILRSSTGKQQRQYNRLFPITIKSIIRAESITYPRKVNLFLANIGLLSAQATKSVDAPTQLSHPSNLESVHCDRDKMADPSPLAVQP